MTAPTPTTAIIGGIDTHADTIHVAAIDDRGAHLDDASFPTTPTGYTAALAYLNAHGPVTIIGIEGTSSYGAGITRKARAAGITVVEVNRPDRAERRRHGKSDPIDAYQAAYAALSGRAHAAAKDDSIHAIRALHNARRSAIKARTATINQIHQQLVVAPDTIRAKYAGLTPDALVKALTATRPNPNSDAYAIMLALKTLAQRATYLGAEHTTLGEHLDTLVTATNPGLRAAYGVGTDVAAQLLITAGNMKRPEFVGDS